MSKTRKTKNRWGMTTVGGVIAVAVFVGGVVAAAPAIEKKLGLCETEPGVSVGEKTAIGMVLAAAVPLLDRCATDSGADCVAESETRIGEVTPATDTAGLVSALAAEESDSFTPIACTLSTADQRELRDTVLSDLWSAAEDVRRTESGVTMRFPAKMMHAITDYIAVESDCCSFFSFRLDVPPNGAPISLGISGPPAAQSLIDGMIESIETAD